jgi:RES domain-containing protein
VPEAWRICPAVHAPDGASAFHGGRWNSKGVSVAYGSAILSLSALEYLVHADARRLARIQLVACRATWPDRVKVESVLPAALAPGWRGTPPPPALAVLGDTWVAEKRTAILMVPSAIVTSEMNVLLNPAHPDAGQISYGEPEPFAYDPRLLGRR